MDGPTPDRLRVAAFALAAGGLVGAALPLSPAGRAALCLGGLLAAAGSALAAEAVALRSSTSQRKRPRSWPGAGSGRIDLTDVRAVPNAEDSSWARFEAIPDEDGEPPSDKAVVDPPPLAGRLALVSVFVGLAGRTWTDAEVARAHRSLARAARWVEAEAGRWGTPLVVDLASVYLQAEDVASEVVEVAFQPEGDTFGPMEARAGFKAMALLARVASQLGFADGVELARRVEARLDADATVWLLHLAGEGRSHAVPLEDRDNPGISLAVCHAREASFPGPLPGSSTARVDPVTVVHELMHLFGASDKYGVQLSAFPPGSVGRRDVMRLDRNRLVELKVGSLTATEVGWHTKS